MATITLPPRGYFKKGDKGMQVVELQRALKVAGFWTFDKITDYYGDITRAAVINFQKANGLKADGLAGRNTIAALAGETDKGTRPTPTPTPTPALVPPPTNTKVTSSSAGDGKTITSSYTGTEGANIAIIIEEAKANGIRNSYSIVGILSVIGKESRFIPQSEKMNYSKGRLAEVWGTFSKTGHPVPKGQGINNYNQKAVEYSGDPVKLANFVYGGRYGNGPEASGDGYRYRGRGFNQITFKGTYEKYARLTGVDLIGNPDLLNDPKVAAIAAIKFLLNRFKEKNIDPNSFTSSNAALRQYAGANAGWGKDPSKAIANAEKIEPHFKIQ